MKESYGTVRLAHWLTDTLADYLLPARLTHLKIGTLTHTGIMTDFHSGTLTLTGTLIHFHIGTHWLLYCHINTYWHTNTL